jgi:multicomponent Na+:H+ antiporter subunit D
MKKLLAILLAILIAPPIGTAAAANGHWAGMLGAAALIVSAILTTLYMLSAAVRFYFPLKDAPAQPEHIHEADRLMTGPLVFLMVLLLALSLCSAPLSAWIGGLF